MAELSRLAPDEAELRRYLERMPGEDGAARIDTERLLAQGHRVIQVTMLAAVD